MKKFILLFSIAILGTLQTATAQVINCDGSKTGAKLTFLSQSGNIIKVLVDWDEGAGFNQGSLRITNGTCQKGPLLGGNQGTRVRQGEYQIEQTDLSAPVTIGWGGPSTQYCGSNTITINAKSRNTLNVGETLKAGEKLYSANGAYMLRMQEDDGNLCIYKSSQGRQGAFVWCSMAHGFKNAWLIMQADGNLCVYTKEDGADVAKWNTRTMAFFDQKWGQSANKPVKMVLENDGSLSLYNAAGSVVWKNQ